MISRQQTTSWVIMVIGYCCLLSMSAFASDLIVREPSQDFGSIPDYAEVERAFTLENGSDKAIRLIAVKPSCGCVLINDVAGQEIAPGESFRLPVRISALGLRGRVQERILVQYAGASLGELRLTLQGTVEKAISVKHPRVMFGQIGRDAVESDVVDLISETVPDFRVIRVETPESLIASVEEVKAGKAYRVHIATRPPLTLGELGSPVLIHTNIPEAPPLRVEVMGIVVGDIAVLPGRIVFANREMPGETAGRSIRVQSTNGEPFTIVRVEPPAPRVEVIIKELDGRGYQIQMSQLVPSELHGKVVRIHTSSATMPLIEVPIQVGLIDVSGR